MLVHSSCESVAIATSIQLAGRKPWLHCMLDVVSSEPVPRD